MKECKLFVENNKQGFSGLISWDNDGKIIIARNTGDDDKPGYYDYSIVKKKDRCTIVELGDRYIQDLYPGITLKEAIEVLKKFGFEIYTKEYHLKQKAGKMIHDYEHETHLIAWNTERSIFVNASTWDNETFNNFDIRIPTHGTSYLDLPYKSWNSEYTELSMNNKMNLSRIFEITEMDKYMKNDKISASVYSYIHQYTDECDEKECKKKEIEDLSNTSAADYFDFY